MRKLAHLLSIGMIVAALPAGARAADDVLLAGCYERVYDKAYLAAHKGQIVERMTLAIKPPPKLDAPEFRSIIANAELKIWVRGVRQSFDSTGACSKEGEGLSCGGSLSAAEADQCRSKHDGIRNCRIDPNDAGSFQIEAKPEGVLVVISPRLELVQAPYDAGPFLNLSQTNAENHAFLLKASGCR